VVLAPVGSIGVGVQARAGAVWGPAPRDAVAGKRCGSSAGQRVLGTRRGWLQPLLVAAAVVAASGTGVVEMAEAPSSTVGGTEAGTVRGVPAMMNTAATTTMKISAAMAGAAAGAAGAVMTARVGGGVAPP
jgi:hypothetical protein